MEYYVIYAKEKLKKRFRFIGDFSKLNMNLKSGLMLVLIVVENFKEQVMDIAITELN